MYARIEYPKIQAFDSNGNLAVGYKVYTYLAGTSTAAASYSNRALSVANTNPIVLDSRGEADLYTGVPLKLIFTTPTGTPASPVWTVDYVGETEESGNIVTGTSAGTTNNNYVVTGSPVSSALASNMMLIMTPDVDNTDTIVSNTFTGTGINDCTASGPYIGSTASSNYIVEIDAIGSPDTFKWKKDAGAETAGVAITGSAQTLAEGVQVTFAVTTGHTLGDLWTIEVMTPARVNLDGLGNTLIYKNENGTIAPVDGGDMKAGYPAQMLMNSTLNGWLLTNPATPVFQSTVVSAVRYRKELAADYTLLLTDQGYELSFSGGAWTLDLLTPPEFANHFFYVANTGTDILTVDADPTGLLGYVIYNGVVSSRYLSVGPGAIYQLQTNGVDWHVMTSLGYPMLIAQSDVNAISVTFTDLLPGVKYRLEFDCLMNVSQESIYIYFNADAGNNYVFKTLRYANAGITSSDYVNQISVCTADDGYLFFGYADFHTVYGNDTLVRCFVNAHGTAATVPYNYIGHGYYDGAAALSSVILQASLRTFTGRVSLYRIG